MDNAVPYRINGNPHLLLNLACWMGEVDAGWELEIESIKYEILHRFRDCLAIREVQIAKLAIN